jgi:2-(1,2-epoxy-1,2-dihydrophenyl)acetyl-CoA isomerase
MNLEAIQYSVQGRVATITLNRPDALNATNDTLYRELSGLLTTIRDDDAIGAGFNIALACDILLASDAAMFSQIFTRLALVPDLGGLYLLTRVVGLNKAKELCFTARKIGAVEAQALGIVNRIVPAAQLLSEAQALAADIAAGPASSLAMIKNLLNKSSTSTLEQMMEYETFAQTVAYITPEHREGVMAFREKRSPKFHDPVE